MLLEIPDALKATLLGANTVKGPVPLSVVAKFAFTTADLSNEKSLLVETISVIVLGMVSAGSSLLLEHEMNGPVHNASNIADDRRFLLNTFMSFNFYVTNSFANKAICVRTQIPSSCPRWPY